MRYNSKNAKPYALMVLLTTLRTDVAVAMMANAQHFRVNCSSTGTTSDEDARFLASLLSFI